MTVKEMEHLSGMTRANIRFYEAEGLLSPARRANGYRDYSEDDLATLKRIRLLRALHLPLEDIRALQAGDRTLADTLDAHLTHLEQERSGLERSEAVCKQLRRDGASYQTLNAQPYLDAMERGPAPQPMRELEQDVIPRLYAPWRRFFARCFDLDLYATLLAAFETLALNLNLLRNPALLSVDLLLATALMLALEPLLLSQFATTPGKALLGLRVTDIGGDRLTRPAALSRTWTVLWRGMGLHLPVYSLVRLWRSYLNANQLDWDFHSAVTLKDRKPWRIGALVAARGGLVAGLCLALVLALFPVHRGALTAEQFCANFNRLSRYQYGEPVYLLTPSGAWDQSDPSAVYISMTDETPPTVTFTEDETGVLTGVSFSQEAEGDVLSLPQSELETAVLAYVRAAADCTPFSDQTGAMLRAIRDRPLEGAQYIAHGVTMTYQIQYSGDWFESLGVLNGTEDAPCRYSYTFSLEQTG